MQQVTDKAVHYIALDSSQIDNSVSFEKQIQKDSVNPLSPQAIPLNKSHNQKNILAPHKKDQEEQQVN